MCHRLILSNGTVERWYGSLALAPATGTPMYHDIPTASPSIVLSASSTPVSGSPFPRQVDMSVTFRKPVFSAHVLRMGRELD